MRNCAHCVKPYKEGSKYCVHCGALITDQAFLPDKRATSIAKEEAKAEQKRRKEAAKTQRELKTQSLRDSYEKLGFKTSGFLGSAVMLHIDRLVDVIGDDEQVECVVHGGNIVATDRRVIILSSSKKRLGVVPYSNLSAIGNSTRVFRGRNFAINGIEVKMVPDSDREKLAQFLTSKISPVASGASEPVLDTIGELERLAGLHKQGVITDKEFATLKGQLIK